MFKRIFDVKTIFLFVFIVAVAAFILFGIKDEKNKTQEYTKWANEINAENKEAYDQKQALAEELSKTDSFYQKLKDGFDVNVLILGDSISAGVGVDDSRNAWTNLLNNYLIEEYGVKVNIKNVSYSGTTASSGYVTCASINDDVDYDLAILCFGDNDEEQGFTTYYESLMRMLRSKYTKCSVISILESSQKDYTNKMKIIQQIADQYSASVADTIAAFKESDKSYSQLTDDDVHPNEAGQKIYFETLKNVIDKNVEDNVKYESGEIRTLSPYTKTYDSYKYYSRSDFKRTDTAKFELTGVSCSDAVLFLDAVCVDEPSGAVIYIDNDGKNPTKVELPLLAEKSSRTVAVALDGCKISNTITIVFENNTQAENFMGICLSNVS